jgi:hypothetical protein
MVAVNGTVEWGWGCTAEEDRNAGKQECGKSESDEGMQALATERRERRGCGGDGKSGANGGSGDSVGDGVGSRKSRKRGYVVEKGGDAHLEARRNDVEKVTVPLQRVSGSVHSSKGRCVLRFMRVLRNYASGRSADCAVQIGERLQTSRVVM